jgi:hypothetical protein
MRGWVVWALFQLSATVLDGFSDRLSHFVDEVFQLALLVYLDVVVFTTAKPAISTTGVEAGISVTNTGRR